MNKQAMKVLDDFKRELRAEMRSLKDSVKHCSDTCDETKQISAELKELRKELSEVIKLNQTLEAENKRLAQRVDELEQYSRINNLEIKGVRFTGDPKIAVQKIGELLGEAVSDEDIDTCHKIPTRSPGENSIVVRFVRRDKRHRFLAKARKQKLANNALGFSGTDPVFVNEHLTPANKKLLGATVARKKQKSWKYVWTNGGKIFARKTDDSHTIKITCESDLTKMT